MKSAESRNDITGPLFFIYRDEPKNYLFDIEIGHSVSGKFTGDGKFCVKKLSRKSCKMRV